MRGKMTDEDRQRFDRDHGLEPIGPVLDLWEDLRNAGGMPDMQPDHVRAMLKALVRARKGGAE